MLPDDCKVWKTSTYDNFYVLDSENASSYPVDHIEAAFKEKKEIGGRRYRELIYYSQKKTDWQIAHF